MHDCFRQAEVKSELLVEYLQTIDSSSKSADVITRTAELLKKLREVTESPIDLYRDWSQVAKDIQNFERQLWVYWREHGGNKDFGEMLLTDKDVSLIAFPF